MQCQRLQLRNLEGAGEDLRRIALGEPIRKVTAAAALLSSTAAGTGKMGSIRKPRDANTRDKNSILL